MSDLKITTQINVSEKTENVENSESNDKVSNNIFANIRHEEYQYLNLLQNILDNGVWEEGRNGKTTSIFGHSMRFSLKDGKIPILTTKKTAWKTCLKEILWFIRGETDNTILKSQGVHIWDANTSREFLDSRGLNDYPEDIAGPIYGRQWRDFNGSYDICNCKPYSNNCSCNNLSNNPERIDQLQNIIDALKDPKQRTSRRLVITSWNPCQLDQMCLPPCHILCQFSVKNGDHLSCAMYQRSVDTFLGSCFNIASYSFLTHLLASHCGLKASEFIYFMGDCHIYENAIDAAKLQLTREPFEFPTVSIKQVRDDINDYQVEDFEIYNYKHHEPIKVSMVA
jgi:thymidylate synthase